MSSSSRRYSLHNEITLHTVMRIISILILVITVSATRLIYHALMNFSGDFPAHILFIREIRKNRHRIPKKISAYLPEGTFGYHCGAHWLLSFIPEKLEKCMILAYGPILESIHAVIIFCIIYFGMPHPGAGNRFTFAFFTALIAMSSPILNRADGRGYGINGRSIGLLLFNITFTSLIIYAVGNHHFGWMALAVFALTLLLLTSQFAFQAFLFFSILILILSGSYYFIMALFTAMITAEIMSFGLYHRFLWINSIRHKILLCHYRKKYEHTNRFSNLSMAFKSIPNILTNPQKTFEAFYRNPIISGLLHLPTLFIVFLGPTHGSDNLWLSWALAGIITMVVIYLPSLRFLGEPHRYLEYISLPCAYLFLKHFPEIGLPHFVILSWFFCVQILNYYAIWISPYSRKKTSQDNEALHFLKQLVPGNLLSIPTFMGIKIALNSRHKIIEFQGIMGSSKRNVDEFRFVYPEEFDYPNRNLSELIKKYHLDYIVLDLSRLELSPRAEDYRFDHFKNLFQNKSMAVYAVS